MERNTETRLAVIVPAYGNWPDTRDCLRILVGQVGDACRLHLADDGSPELPPADLQNLDGVAYQRGESVGFASNCNRAAEIALGEGATHLLFLNNDTLVGPRFLEAWGNAVRAHPDAILSPLIREAGRPERIWHSGGRKSVWAPFVRHRRSYADATPVDMVCGCCLLVPGAAWTRLQGFDPGYRMYFEDFDLSLRAKDSGIEILVLPDPDLDVLHKVSGSFRNHPWGKERMLIRSRRQFVRRHYSGAGALVCSLLELPHFLFRLAANFPAIPDAAVLREVLRWEK